MASTAAWSAAILLPLPRKRAAETAARRDAHDFEHEDTLWNGNELQHPSTLQAFSMAD
jgi:hypothetical protein